MAYSPYTAVNAIYKIKGQIDSANKAGDESAKTVLSQKAQKYINELKRNGYGDVADELNAADYTTSKNINDKWAKMDKTPTRKYLYTLGQKYGMSNSEVDGIIDWDNDTGQVSLGGKVVGTPDAVVDGVSYWNDTSKLDNAFNDYISSTGRARAKETAVNQENENLFAKYNQEFEDLKKTNPFETDTAKAILAKYDLAGLQGRDNEVASGGASNGGNIDSFSAANALRQQTALVSQGQSKVLEVHQQKLDHARALLSDMGVNIDRVFNQDETSKNNKVSRDVATSEVTGVVPTSMLYQMPYYNQFFNSDGTLKNSDIDYKAEIEKAEAAGNSELAKVLRAARGVKIFSDYGKYGKYADGDYTLPGNIKTETAREFDEKIASAERIAKGENDTTIAVAEQKAATPAGMTLAQATSLLKSGELNDTVLDVYNKAVGGSYTKENPPPIYKPAEQNPEPDNPAWVDDAPADDGKRTWQDWAVGYAAGNKYGPFSQQKGASQNSDTAGAGALTDAQVKGWAERLNKEVSTEYGVGTKAIELTADGKYKSVPASTEYTVIRVLESDELTDAQKQYLLFEKFGISPDTLNRMLNDPHYN